jgi:hypothetical protein
LVLLHKVVIVLEYQQIELINNNIKQNIMIMIIIMIIMVMINRYNNNNNRDKDKDKDKQINNNKYIH